MKPKRRVKEIIKIQASRVVTHIVNVVQKNILGDDKISNTLRMFMLRLLGVRYGDNSKIFGGCDVLGGQITLGNGVTINRCCYFDLTGSVVMEDQVGVGHGVTFITAHHEMGPVQNRAGHNLQGYISSRDIVVKEGAWIAANATIMPGVIIGKGAVVAACALVTKDVEDNTVVAGVPAKIIKKLDDNTKHKLERSGKRTNDNKSEFRKFY